MGRCHGFQQQQSSYSMHKESRQQQQSYSMHRESRNYSNNCELQNHVTAIQSLPSLGIIDHSHYQARQHQSNLHDTGFRYSYGGGKSTVMPFASSGFNGSASAQFPNFGNSSAAVFNGSLGSAEFGVLEEVFRPATGTVWMEEVSYERRSWGSGSGSGGGARFGDGFEDGGGWNGYSRVEWISKVI